MFVVEYDDVISGGRRTTEPMDGDEVIRALLLITPYKNPKVMEVKNETAS